jgi:serine/threonine protein phosphatase PrpC
MKTLGPEDAIYLRERDMDAPEIHAFVGGQAALLSVRAPDKETPNEDAAALIPFDAKSGVLLIADGAGGMRGGTQASSIALHELAAALELAHEKGGVLREAILDGIEAANREIVTLGIGAATTLVVAEIHEGSLRPYHVGDSGILAFGQKGKLKLQTMFHSPTGYAVEAGLLDEKAALRHDERHLVSNVIGTPDMRIEMGGRIAMSAKDTVLLATDGLFDNLHTAEIVELLRKGPLETALRDLAAAARKRMASENGARPGKPDDLTLVGFRLD